MYTENSFSLVLVCTLHVVLTYKVFYFSWVLFGMSYFGSDSFGNSCFGTDSFAMSCFGRDS